MNQTLMNILFHYGSYSRDLYEAIQTYVSPIEASSLFTYDKLVKLLADEIENSKDVIRFDISNYPSK
jgi:hypothetical protein